MSKHVTVVNTDEGHVTVMTKSRWLAIIPIPHTSVVPESYSDLGRLGTFIRWLPSDAAALKAHHAAVVHLVEERGISGVARIAADEKAAARTAKTLGLTYQEMAEEVRNSRAPISDIDDVIRFVKKFM